MKSTTATPVKAMYKKAVKVATKAHEGQKRSSGEPYIEHPKAVADILKKDLFVDEETLCAAVLHDTIEDTAVTADELEQEFGSTITKLVEGVTKVAKAQKEMTKVERSMESVRKMFRSMGKDMRVIFIKLADRLHNMRTLESVNEEKKQRIARETRNVYCPLANLLGIRPWYHELSDLCFRILEPSNYDLIVRKQKEANQKHLKHLQQWVSRMRTFIRREDFASLEIHLKPRHIHSIYESTQAQLPLLDHAESFHRIVITTDSIDNCYKLLGRVHQFSTSVPQRMDDCIAHPKINGYQALHTTIISSLGNPIRVIIQTKDMLVMGQYGVALAYQQNTKPNKQWQTLPKWVDSLMSLDSQKKDIDRFFTAVQTEIFGERYRVYVAGYKKKSIELPSKSSVLDAAYYVGQNCGKYCKSVLVNGKPSPLKTLLHDGDVLELNVVKRGIQRMPKDMLFTHTSYGQKMLIETLSSVSHKNRISRATSVLQETIDVLIDPFFSIVWRKFLERRVLRKRKILPGIANGIINPFSTIEQQCNVADFFLLDPRVFSSFVTSGEQKIRFAMRASLEDLREGNIIGLHLRPDVIDVISLDSEELQEKNVRTKELIPLEIENKSLLKHPFHFALQWTFSRGSNPLKTISILQNLLDTPIDLLHFDRTSVILEFHTDSLATLRIAYEYLYSLPEVKSILRTSP